MADAGLMMLYELAEAKGRFIYELGDLPVSELNHWVAYYRIKSRK